MRLQAQYTFENMKKVLAEAGASLKDVVKLTAFLTDPADYPLYDEVRRRYFAPHYPASTSVAVKALMLSGLLLEVDAVAVKSD